MPKTLVNFEQADILPPESVINWGKTLIVAPHPDDESLGCGGALALLRKFGCEVVALTMSDGTLSHPNSVEYPPEELRGLRENEMRNALEILGIAPGNVTFFRLSDRRVPDESAENFASTVEKIKHYLRENLPQTILVPWRRDPHPDHQATWQIFNRANEFFAHQFRILEYPIWLWEMAQDKDLPTENIKIFRLNIENVTDIKQRAINAHVSQTTDLIDDDPHGFRLSPEVLAHFAAPFEYYLEEVK